MCCPLDSSQPVASSFSLYLGFATKGWSSFQSFHWGKQHLFNLNALFQLIFLSLRKSNLNQSMLVAWWGPEVLGVSNNIGYRWRHIRKKNKNIKNICFGSDPLTMNPTVFIIVYSKKRWFRNICSNKVLILFACFYILNRFTRKLQLLE